MYKFLLCTRYLRTRYIALASIVSVTLGVATMIVVNSVMAGFSREMQDRIHGILSDLTFESNSLEGFQDPKWHMDQIHGIAGEYIAGMTPTVHVPAMLSFQVRGQTITRQITFIGIDEESHAQVSDFGKYLQHPTNREKLSFGLHEGGYDTRDHQVESGAPERPMMEMAGWHYRREKAKFDSQRFATRSPVAAAEDSANSEGQAAAAEPSADGTEVPPRPHDPFKAISHNQGETFDPAKEQRTGLVMGIGLATVRSSDGKDHFLVLPGDDVQVTVPTAGTPPKIVWDSFTVTDFYESKMSEYDSNFVFVPLAKLQEMRGMFERATNTRYATSIQIRLKDEKDAVRVRDLLRERFPPELYSINTWRDKQGPLLAAVQMETAVLNILLFLIIAVAGFGILAIFFMIVVEKTRDIGILKSLGASGRGIMGIFLAYGLSLGTVGAGAGMVLGLLFVRHINDIRVGLEKITGQPVFDPSIYYFYKIPTVVNPFTVSWIVLGALAIAVLASILPAIRAARLHPVEALRYE